VPSLPWRPRHLPRRLCAAVCSRRWQRRPAVDHQGCEPSHASLSQNQASTLAFSISISICLTLPGAFAQHLALAFPFSPACSGPKPVRSLYFNNPLERLYSEYQCLAHCLETASFMQGCCHCSQCPNWRVDRLVFRQQHRHRDLAGACLHWWRPHSGLRSCMHQRWQGRGPS